MSSADQIIASITKSQTAEGGLITQLNTLVSQPGFQASDATGLINAIQGLSDARISLFNSLSQQATTLQQGVANSRVDLVSQMTLLNVVEDQLTKARESLSTLQNQNDTKKRMIEVNTYYGKRYEAKSNFMKMLIVITSVLLVLFILKKKSLLPPMISNYAIGITIAVGAIFVIRVMWDMFTRSNMNYDEYNWVYERPDGQIPTVWQYNKENLFNFDNPLKNLMGNLGLCVGSSCCANGLYFDKTKQQCTTIPTGQPITTGTESFVCGSNLQGSNVAKFDPEEEKQNGISPFNSFYENSFASIQ